MKSGSLETERKYLGADFQALRASLLNIGAVTDGSHFESNAVLDTPKLELAARGGLLRLRRQQWPDHEKFRLTFKCKPDFGLKEAVQGVKAREELEMEIPDLDMMREILDRLGFRQVAAYEKIRESWRFAIAGGLCEADLDMLVFGNVVELEAKPEVIDAAARTLGLDKCESSTKNYHELNMEWRKANKMPFSANILFDQEEKKRIYRSLGLSN